MGRRQLLQYNNNDDVVVSYERTNRVSNGGDMKNENWLAVSVARDTIPRSSHR